LHGQPVGTFGVACFSFYPTKNMTTGEGGMVTTTDAALADRMRLIRNHGMRARYEYEVFGTNLRMTDMAAAMGRVQLRHLDAWNQARRRNAAWLDAHLRGVITPRVRANVVHVYHQYTVCAEHRDELIERLRAHGIGHGVYYPVPVHRTAPYAVELDLPVTERLTRQVLSLPVRPDLTGEELERIAEAVNG
jgi:dTDP-4-amino-4,6-dideoxygalactose transaminase